MPLSDAVGMPLVSMFLTASDHELRNDRDCSSSALQCQEGNDMLKMDLTKLLVLLVLLGLAAGQVTPPNPIEVTQRYFTCCMRLSPASLERYHSVQSSALGDGAFVGTPCGRASSAALQMYRK